MAQLRFHGTLPLRDGAVCQHLELTDGELSIGRNEGNTLRVVDVGVSKQHALVRHDNGDYWIEDVGSRNGTTVNGVRLERPQQLFDGDRVQIGGMELRFLLDTSLDSLEVIADGAAPATQTRILQPAPSRVAEVDRYLRSIANLADVVGGISDPLVLRERLLDTLMSGLDVDRALIAFLDPATGELVREAQRRRQRSRAKEEVVKISGAMVQRVRDEGIALISSDAAEDMATPSIAEFGIGSMMCAPLKWEGQVVGLVYVDALDRKVQFGSHDQNFFLAMSAIIGATLESGRFVDDLKASNRDYLRDLAAQGNARMLYSSPAMERTMTIADRYARSRDTLAPVLIGGERGTGKTRMARFIHERSARRDGPFQVVDCASIPEALAEATLFGHEKGAFTGADARKDGRFQAADGGTLFFDEVGELPLPIQAKLLVAIRDGLVSRVGSNEPEKVSVRVIAATNRNLAAMADEGTFRPDLLDRLAVLQLHVPPLRERREDIPVLARHFLALHGGLVEADGDAPTPALELTSSAVLALQAHDWPGNVAGLENEIRRLIAMADGESIHVHDLPETLRDGISLPEHGLRSLEEVEREVIRETLARTGGNQKRAARILGINRGTLAEKLKRYEQA